MQTISLVDFSQFGRKKRQFLDQLGRKKRQTPVQGIFAQK